MRGEQLTMDEFLDLDDLLPREVTQHRQVLEFHRRFDVPRPAEPRLLDGEAYEFRVGFMQEELREFCQAHMVGDLEQSFDALLDLAYVVIGTAIMMGLPWDEGFDEVHRANMEKQRTRRAADSKRGTALDVTKPEGWQPPNLAAVLDEHRRDVAEHVRGLYDEP